MLTHGFRAGADVVATKLGIILLLSFFFFLPCTYFSPRRGLPRKLKFGGWPNLTLTRRFSPKKNGEGTPPQKKISKNYFFSISILTAAGGVRALWVSEHPLWRTQYLLLLLLLIIIKEQRNSCNIDHAGLTPYGLNSLGQKCGASYIILGYIVF